MEEFTHGEKFINTNKILRWLDRQAAKTEREAFMRGRASLDDEFAECVEEIAELTAERDEWKAKAESALHENPYVGLVRGKQWERTEKSDYYCGRCGWKVTDHDSYCPECGGALHKASNKPDGKFDARKTAEMPETDATKEHIRDFDDTREQLEADLLEWIDIAAYKAFKPERMLEVMLHWLDRQAAITHELDNVWARAQQTRIAELTAERDELLAAIDAMGNGQFYAMYRRACQERDALRERLEAITAALHDKPGT